MYFIGFYEEKEFFLYIFVFLNEFKVFVRWVNIGVVFFDWKVNVFYLCSVLVIYLLLVGFNLVIENGYRYLCEDKFYGFVGGFYNF